MAPQIISRKPTNKTRKQSRLSAAVQQADISVPAIQASQNVLTKSQRRSKAVLDHAVKQAAAGIRSGSKAIAKISEDPEVQKEFAITVEKVGDALAAVAEDSGEITADMVEKFGPAAQQYLLAGNELIRNSLVTGVASIFGLIPFAGDAVDAAIEQANNTNKSVTKWVATTMTAVPAAVSVADSAVKAAEQSMSVISNTQEQVNKLAGAIDNVAKAIEVSETKAAKAVKMPTQKTKKQSGGKTRRRRRRRRRRRKKRH